MDKLVSVIIPIYGVEKELPRCLDSLRQCVPGWRIYIPQIFIRQYEISSSVIYSVRKNALIRGTDQAYFTDGEGFSNF